MRFSFLLPVFLTAFALGGCADIMTGQTKDITVRTPGAENALCLLDNGTIVVQAYTDQTVRINKNYKDLKVTCDAPGNRTVSKVFELQLEPWAAGDVVTGVVPGLAYDVASKGVYDYPDEIVMNFTGLKSTQYPLPAYHTKDAVKPGSVIHEEYGTTNPELKGERYEETTGLRKIDPSEYSAGSNPYLSNQELGGSKNNPVSLTGE